jgi:ABC-2 type transport system permease protein
MASAERPGFAAVARREARRLRADFWDLGMLTWIPLALCALLWWIFSAGTPRDLPVAWLNRDDSSLSRTLARMLDESPGVALRPVASEAEAVSLMRERQVYGLVVVPRDFQQRILTGGAATVQWAYNAQFAAHAGTLTRDVRTVVATLSVGTEMLAREKRGAAPVQAAQLYEPIRLKLVTLFNENANYEAFLALSAIPGLAQIFIALAAVVAVGRELRQGTVREWMEAAGHSWTAAVAGKLAWPAAAFAVQGAIFIAFFAGWRGWAIQGSAPMVVLALAAFIAAYLALGVLLVAATLSLRTALSAAAFITAPAFAFSGQGFPLIAMPPLARAWGEALPLTHYLQLQGRHWLEGAPASYGLGELAVLAAFAAVGFALAGLLLKRRALDASRWGAL